MDGADPNKGVSMFSLGNLVSTPAALSAFNEEGVLPLEYIRRHQMCDWGDLESSDKKLNDLAVTGGDRIFSAYVLPKTSVKIWIITEHDRSQTTVMLPSDY